MALINHVKGEINAKIVYYGPGSAGKETNLNYIYRKIKPENRGQMKTMNVEKNRMLFFDFTPAGQGKIGDYNLRFHIYSIVGEVSGNTAWKMVLKGVDGIVFVADSTPDRMKTNAASLDELREIMSGYGMSIKDLPGVLQCNKRDIYYSLPLDEMENALNYGGFAVKPAVAGKGEGVLESLFALMKEVTKNLRESGIVPGVEPEQPAPPETAIPEEKEEFAPPIEPALLTLEEEQQIVEPEPLPTPLLEEPQPIILAEEVVEAEQPVLEAIEEIAAPETPTPVIEIAGLPEPYSGGRLRLPLRVRCGGQEKEVTLSLTVAVELE
jgi:signal recognition particle receptor subunit beta